MNEKSSCPVLRGRDGGNTILLLDKNTTDEQFNKARSLQGAIMPDGSKHS